MTLLLYGCFEPEGENFVVVDKPSFEGLEINLINANSPVYIYRPTHLTYKIEQDGYQLVRLEGYIDGISIIDPKNPTRLLVDPAKFANGSHTLAITAAFVNQSESLSSILGKEEKLINRDFEIVVDLVLGDPVEIKSIEPEMGTLYVRWDPPEKSNFLNYEVKRFFKDTNGQWVEYHMPKPWTLDATALYFRDSLYIGGDVRYRVDLLGYKSTRSGIHKDTHFKTLQFEIQPISDDQVVLRWPPSLFYNNITTVSLGTYNKPEQKFEPNQSGEVTIDTPFGHSTVYYLSTFGRYSDKGWADQFHVWTGDKLEFDGISSLDTYGFHHYGAREMLISDNSKPDEALLVNSVTGSIDRRVEFEAYYQSAGHQWSAEHSMYGKSFDGKNFYLFTGMEVIRFDQNMDYLETIDFTAINSGFSMYAHSIEVSNDGVACFYISGQVVGVFDLQKKIKITPYLQATPAPPHISPNSKFFFNDGTLYTIVNDQLSQLILLNDRANIRDAVFSSSSDRLFVVYRTGHMDVIDLSTRNVVQTFSFQGNSFSGVSYDPLTGYVGFVVGDTQTTYLVIDPIGNSLVKSLKVAYPSYEQFRLFNNVIYSTRGFAFPL
ncbi:hypothetical protein [Chryseolinea sp. H1M3-3]|uniref:hypothetical protein n=1 Tax=Chryseolinea sp. H1M3-3 TaxID=3034144 RepID=UPI0023EB00A1|nr:hypothetical protein [Chryseolinea sp. H1M3-3]